MYKYLHNDDIDTVLKEYSTISYKHLIASRNASRQLIKSVNSNINNYWYF